LRRSPLRYATVRGLQAQVDRRGDDPGNEENDELEERVGSAFETLIKGISEGT